MSGNNINRINAFTIELVKYPNVELGDLLNTWNNEMSKELQPQLNKYDIVWFNSDEVPIELFNYADYFNWISGSAKLWVDGNPLTRFNYRTPVYIESDNEMILDHYDYIDINSISDIAPVVEDSEVN